MPKEVEIESDDYEVIPVGPIRKLEERIRKMEREKEQESKEKAEKKDARDDIDDEKPVEIKEAVAEDDFQVKKKENKKLPAKKTEVKDEDYK